ncbi:MAG: HEAT repeat domain-containing protein [Endomicrobiia bacterium]|nr:HEAT repeat domain-containing protein [Endomicrobiia bacterium]
MLFSATAAALSALPSVALSEDFQTLKLQYEHGLAEKRSEALAKMAAHKTPEALAFLKDAALKTGEEKEVRLAAVTALGAFGGKEAFDGVMRAMGDRDEAVRKKARSIVLASKNDAVFETLKDFIGVARNDTILSYEILSAMAEFPTEKTPPIFESLSADNDNIRYAVARVLPSLGASETTKRLTESFLKDELGEIRAEAARAAATMKLYPLVDRILPLLSDKSPVASAAAATSLEQLANPVAMVYWLDAFKSPKPKIRSFAAATVCRMGKPEALPHVFSLLDDKAAEVRETADASISSVFRAHDHVFFMINELGSKNILKRKTALRLLASSGDSSVVPALFSAMRYERDAAIISAYTRSVSALARADNLTDIRSALGSHAKHVRIAAAASLAAVSGEKYPEAFAIFLNRVKEETDAEAIKEMLNAFAAMKPVPYRLAYAWTSGRWPNDVKISACEFLGIHGETEAITPLIMAAENPSHEVSWRARDAIEKLVVKPSDAAALSEHLETRNKSVRLFILGMMKKYPSKAAVDNFGKINYGKTDTETRYAMVEAIRALRPDGGHPVLADALRDGSAEVRWLAAKTVSETAGDNASGFLMTSLSDSSPAVREEALKSLARAPRFEYASRIRPYLNDPDVSVKRAAIAAIEHITDDESLKIIQGLLLDQDATLRASAAGIVGKAKMTSAVETLKKMAESDYYPECRRAAARALAGMKITDDKTVAIFFALVKDADSSVRTEAAAILDAITDKSHRPHIIKSLYDENRHARAYALSAIARLNLYEANAELFNLAKIMRRDNRAQNREILSTLGRLIDEGDVPELVVLYEMNNPDLKLWAIEHAARLKSEAAADLSARALREENPAFRQKALESLTGAKHARIRSAIKYIADNDPDPMLRRLATEKLK